MKNTVEVAICPKCKMPIFPCSESIKNGYAYACPYCDEDFYDFECEKITVEIPKRLCRSEWQKRWAIFEKLDKAGMLGEWSEFFPFQTFQDLIDGTSYRDKHEIINLCDYKAIKEKGSWVLIDQQHANLGNIESEKFKTLKDVFDRMSDTYFYENGYSILPG